MVENSSAVSPKISSYGLMAEFDSAEKLLDAAEKTKNMGYSHWDAFSPFPLHGLSEAMGIKTYTVQKATLGGGIIGGLLGYGLQYVVNVFIYPINVGGRPLNSIPSFIPITFELTILLSALTAAFGMLILNGFPRLYHPVFNVGAFRKASIDSFFICIERQDPLFEEVKVRGFFEALGARGIYDVEA